MKYIWNSYLHYESHFISHHFTTREDTNSTNWLRSQCVASQLSWLSIALVSRRSGVRIPLKPWYFQASSFQFLKLENLLQWSLFTFKCVKLRALFCNFTLPIYCCSKLKYCFLSHYQCCCSKYKFSLRPFLSISLYTKCELYLFKLYSLISHFRCCCTFDAL